MDIEQIIYNSLRRLSEEYEQKREVLLSILHLNIDALINNAEKWFGDEVPDDYRAVIRSLMSLSTSFWKPNLDYDALLFDDKPSEIDLAVLLDELLAEFNYLRRTMKIAVRNDTGGSRIFSQRKPLNQALTNILLSLYTFMNPDSACAIALGKAKSNILLGLKFTGLSEQYPGRSKIQRPFFPYHQGNTYRIGIGINSALYYLRSCGAQVKMSEPEGERSLEFKISFVSAEFMRMVNTMRKNEDTDSGEKMQGEVIIFIDDFVLEMITREILEERGYRVVKCSLSQLDGCINYEEFKAIIVDYAYIIKYFMNFKVFISYIADFRKVIILYGSEEEDILNGRGDEKFILLKKPFGVDDIIKNIESAPGE